MVKDCWGQGQWSQTPLPLFLSLTESVMGLQPLLFIAETVKGVLGRAVQFCMHANSSICPVAENTGNIMN